MVIHKHPHEGLDDYANIKKNVIIYTKYTGFLFCDHNVHFFTAVCWIYIKHKQYVQTCD